MSLCINPSCSKPENPDTGMFCQTCGSELLLGGRYRVTGLLSDKGGFGNTYEVIHKSTAKVLKVLTNNDPKAVELFQQEARILKQLNHPGIPQGDSDFSYSPKDSQTPIYCLVMEKIEGMDLEAYQEQRQDRPIDQKLALEWLIQLAKILDEVHQQNFFHRDIKPPNIILKPDGQLVLIDFGAVRQVTATIMAGGQNTGIYTQGYAPPEQEKGYAVPQSDFFAVGRTFVYLLTGKNPIDPAIYDPQNDKLNWRNHTVNLSPLLADFIDKLMEREASKRPGNPQMMLRKLREIELSLYPPKPQPVVPKLPVAPTVPVAPINPIQPQQTRRKFIQKIGAAGITVVGGSLIWEALKGKSPSPILENTPTTKLALKSFDFEVLTVNSQGREINRQSKQAKFFTDDAGNGIKLEMVSIPGGTFQMGSYESAEEKLPHQVQVKPFFIGKFTITQAQWEAVMNTNPSNFKGANRPVETVSWNDAVEFCSELSKKTGKTYRLPSEAEWEYACRAGTTTAFHFGETITTDLVNYDGNYPYASAPKGEDRQQTTEVGKFPPNAFGLYEMHGNVYEWCADHWHENYQNAPNDGTIWLSSDESLYRLLRGGSWSNIAHYCRAAYRGGCQPDNRFNSFGFRVVCS